MKGIRSSSFFPRNEPASLRMPEPPRGVFVPTQLIFHPQLPAATLVSWIKLRSLAWRGFATPPMTLPELASHLGIHPARLSRHLAQLQDISALALRQTSQEKLILSFPEEPIALPMPHPALQVSAGHIQPAIQLQEEAPHASYFPERILGYLSYDDEHDPLYLELEKDGSSCEGAGATRISPKIAIRKPAEHALVGK